MSDSSATCPECGQSIDDEEDEPVESKRVWCTWFDTHEIESRNDKSIEDSNLIYTSYDEDMFFGSVSICSNPDEKHTFATAYVYITTEDETYLLIKEIYLTHAIQEVNFSV